MNPRENALGGGDGSLEALDDLGQGIADLSLLFELVFEVVEDGGVEEGGVGGHDGWWEVRLCG